MNEERSEISNQANLLRAGYEVGYFTKSDIERWAESQIAISEHPSIEIIELVMLCTKHERDVISLLNSVGSTIAPDMAAQYTIGFIGKLFRSKKMSLQCAVRALFAIVHDQGLTEDERSMIYQLDDGYDLAVQGTYGTLADVECKFLDYTARYVWQLAVGESQLLIRQDGA